MVAVEPSDPPTRDAAWRHFDPPQLSPILSAALEEFYERGFHGTSVRGIANRVGVTVPALYYHHKNKESILLDLLEFSTSDLLLRAYSANAEAGNDPVQRLANVVEVITLAVTHRAHFAALESEVRYLSPDNRLRYRVVRKGTEELVQSIVDAGVASGQFHATDPRETTRAILAMCQAIPRWFDPSGTLTPRDVSQRYVEIALSAAGHVR